MDTLDRPGASNLPSPFRAIPTPVPVLPSGYAGDLAHVPTRQVSPKTLLRGLTRHWWQILLIWLIVSVPAVCLIYRFVQPTYEAFSTLRVTPTSWKLYERSESDQTEFKPYLQTQIGLIKSDRVLGPAIASAAVEKLSTITESEAPKDLLRERMTVEIVKDSYVIRVALELPDKHQATAIVNAVVQAYLRYDFEYKRGENSGRRKSREEHLKELRKQISDKREELRNLYKKGNVSPPKENRVRKGDDGDDVDGQPSVSEEQSDRLAAKTIETELEIIRIDSILKTREGLEQMSGDAAKGDKQQERQIKELFQKDPDVIALCEQIAFADEERAHARRMIVKGNDPARRRAEDKYETLRGDYNKLWEEKYPQIVEQLKMAAVNSDRGVESTEALKNKLESLKTELKRQRELVDKLKVQKKIVDNDIFDASFVNRELEMLMHKADLVDTQSKQLEFEATSQEAVRITLIDDAVAPSAPTNNKHIKYMAVAPLALLFMILSLFCLLEVRAERVADPDTLSTRVGSEVYALPPLITPRALRKMSDVEAADQVEQFMQRLDHLRFAVCGSPSELGKGRCVLITSAIGGEGKTNLATNLAMRCGGAGMSILLIDADLRRTSLCSLLDVPEGPGLSDVLEESAAIGDVVIPVQGGAFYLLRAGTPTQETNRLFQGRNLGLLISQLRQQYDLIIIDSPPILPVPDALILGRWVDGVILAARYDISRFPQVERARRQLDAAGIPIMGTVINGMRNADSYYGRYSYSRRRTPQANPSDTI